MIELRFFERSQPAPQYGTDISQVVKVLQYRQTGKSQWTDWQDVPTIREEAK